MVATIEHSSVRSLPMGTEARLVRFMHDLSLTRTKESIFSVFRRAARELTGADGAAFVLRDENNCYYVEEDAIGPLWKGSRFPMSSCVSGWAMKNRCSLQIEDIYTDDRVPHEAYRPTFVKSLAMVPIRPEDPLGAIGNYWKDKHLASADEVLVLEMLANSTAVALENVNLYAQLNNRIRELEVSNEELSRLAWAASHDFREPLRAVNLYLQLLERSGGSRSEEEREYIDGAKKSANSLSSLVSGLGSYSSILRTSENFTSVDPSKLLEEVIAFLKPTIMEKHATVEVPISIPEVYADPSLIGRVFQNLLSNALKFTSDSREPEITVTFQMEGPNIRFTVEDNGIGIAQRHHERIFRQFERLHGNDEFSGSGLGLAICKKIVTMHGGELGVQSREGVGSTFFFTLPAVV